MAGERVVTGNGAPNNVIADLCAALGISVFEACCRAAGSWDASRATEQSDLMRASDHGCVQFVTTGGYLAGQLTRSERDELSASASESAGLRWAADVVREFYDSKDSSSRVAMFNSRQVDPIGRGSKASNSFVGQTGLADAVIRKLRDQNVSVTTRQMPDGTITVDVENMARLDRFLAEYIERNRSTIAEALSPRSVEEWRSIDLGVAHEENDDDVF